MSEERDRPLGLTDEEIDRLMDPILSIEERMSVWEAKPLRVQACKLQKHWKASLKGPLVFGLFACLISLLGLNVAVLSQEWRAEGTATWIVCFLLMFASACELHRLGRLKVDEI
ncbi:MAG: hypothetical protein AAGL66_11535 [Pseudomonadota bacterium]